MMVQCTRFCFYLHQVKNSAVSSGMPVKLASVKNSTELYWFCLLLFTFVGSVFLFASVLSKEGWRESRSKTDPESVWRALEV